jgi:hypothetical protein
MAIAINQPNNELLGSFIWLGNDNKRHLVWVKNVSLGKWIIKKYEYMDFCETICFIMDARFELQTASMALDCATIVLYSVTATEFQSSRHRMYSYIQCLKMSQWFCPRSHCPVPITWDHSTNTVSWHDAWSLHFRGNSTLTGRIITVRYLHKGLSEFPPFCMVCWYAPNIRFESHAVTSQVYNCAGSDKPGQPERWSVCERNNIQ